MIVVSDGASDDNFDKQATHLHEKMLVKIAAVVTKSFNKDRLLPITRFDGSVFLLDQQQALSIWLWRQQRMWTENFAEYVEREKTLTNLMESSRHPQQQQQQPESPKKSKKKKQQPKPETKRTN
uniref:Uncharacterized protein n=1 Tax=Panagrolaimus davidi TaxID=227884 RepID=A0A914QBY8_9BILA